MDAIVHAQASLTNPVFFQASRRAAASFFFEMLVLATRDCVQVSQPSQFGNIEVRAKDKLWERQRHGFIAPSYCQLLYECLL